MLQDGNVGWTAATYFASFWIYLLVSVGEFVGWCFYLAGQPEWFGWWVGHVGWYGSIFFGLLPNLFAAFQLGFPSTMGGLAGNESVDFGNNTVFLLTIGIAVWFQSALLHWIFTPRLDCYIELNPAVLVQKTIECPLKQQIGQSEEDYQNACKEIFKAAKDT